MELLPLILRKTELRCHISNLLVLCLVISRCAGGPRDNKAVANLSRRQPRSVTSINDVVADIRIPIQVVLRAVRASGGRFGTVYLRFPLSRGPVKAPVRQPTLNSRLQQDDQELGVASPLATYMHNPSSRLLFFHQHRTPKERFLSFLQYLPLQRQQASSHFARQRSLLKIYCKYLM